MNKEFIPYEEALALTELDIDFGMHHYQHYSKSKELCEKTEGSIPALLYSQLFRGLNRDFDTDIWIKKLLKDEWEYAYLINEERQKSKKYPSKEEAEEACAKKLVELVKIL